VNRLPETMSLAEVERRAARMRRWLVSLAALLLVATLLLGIAAVWTGDVRWTETAALLFLAAWVPAGIYAVVNTPLMVPRMSEHYRQRGVRIREDGQE
jgi:hypothetical protein